MTFIVVNNYNDHGLRDKVIEYLESHPNYADDKPYFYYRGGKSYTLKEVRDNVDGELDRLIRNLLLGAIDLLTRGKRLL